MRKLMWFALGFAGSCAFGAYCYGDWFIPASWVGLSVSLLFFALSAYQQKLRILSFLCMGIAAGSFWFSAYDALVMEDARTLDNTVISTTIYVSDYSEEKEYGVCAEGYILLEGKYYPVRIYVYEDQSLEPGNHIFGTFRFRFTSDGSQQDKLYCRSDGIFLVAYQKGNVVVERCWSVPLVGKVSQWRHGLLEIIHRTFPRDTVGFAKALLLGDRTDIDYETGTAFKVSGISHVIAVSGLHISILFGLIHILTGKRRFLMALIGIPVLFLFAAIVGFTPSITRATMMQTLCILASLFDREYDPLTGLGFSGLVMLIWNPLVIASVSFQLSFACMAGILIFAVPIRDWMLKGDFSNRLRSGLAASLSVSLSAMVFTTPLVAVHFGCVSLIGPVTNICCLWVISFIFYGIMAVCALGAIHLAAGAFVAKMIALPIRFVLWVSKVLAQFPLAAVYTKSNYIVFWLIFAYVLLGIFLVMKKKPVALFSGLVAAGLALCVGLSWLEPMLDNYRMTVLDVGQGQAILLQSSGKTYLVDCGGDYDEDAADITAETLLSQGISRLDGIIVTHFDRDHTGGLPYLLRRIHTELLLLPYIVDEDGVGQQLADLTQGVATWVREDLTLSYEDTRITVFGPEDYDFGNESSICVLFQPDNCDILITGDRGFAGEKLLLRRDLPQLDALVVGHHGSKHSTCQELLQDLQPRYALISAGKNNTYGHPAQETLTRLLDMGCIIYRTDEDGTIIYRG